MMQIQTIEDIDKIFEDEISARKYLASLRWGQWAKCPICGNEKCYFIENGIKYKCANKSCYKKFSITSKTLIEATNIDLRIWIKIVFTYVKTRGRCMSWDLEKEFNVSRVTAFICKEKLDFAFKYIDRIGKSNTEIVEELFKKIFTLYEFYDQFQSTKYTSKWHIYDGDIDDLGDKRQYNILINYIKYYVNVYCHWIWMDFASPADILAETFIKLNEKGIKEYNGSTIIKHIQQQVNTMWNIFLKNHHKYANFKQQRTLEWKRDGRINLKDWYIVQLIKTEKNGTMTLSEIRSNKSYIQEKRESIIKKRNKSNKNYGFISHFS